jgi:hypothetical protein
MPEASNEALNKINPVEEKKGINKISKKICLIFWLLTTKKLSTEKSSSSV